MVLEPNAQDAGQTRLLLEREVAERGVCGSSSARQAVERVNSVEM